MKLALVQMSPVTGDLQGNLARIKNEISSARENGADLVVFPEMALTGYCISDLVEDDLFVEKNKELLDEIAVETSGLAVVVGFIDYDRDMKNHDGRMRKYNAAALIQNGEVLGIVHKTLLPNYRYFDDKRYFTPGEKREPLKIKVGGKEVRLGISICEDAWDSDYDIKPINELVEKGIDLVVNINASPFHAGKFFDRQKMILRHVENAKVPFVYLNTVGSADNGKNIIPFDGQSLVYDGEGNLVALGKSFEEEILNVDLDNLNTVDEPDTLKEKGLFEALVMGIRDYANQVGFKKTILPLSGGVDSALGLVLTVEALGAENVVAYNLPSKFNTAVTKGIAKELAENLGVEYKIIPIQEIDDTLKKVFTENVREIEGKVSKENLHARIRGILMMLESNDTGALLISNGNKTEIALGYSTLYGDMCGGISVIGDLSKLDVYAVCKYYNERAGKEVIPKEIFTIAPSAELSEDQVDPFDYDLISPLVELFVEERHSPQEIVEMFKDQNLGRKFKDKVYQYDLLEFERIVYDTHRLIRRSVYKRLQGPPIIAVTKRSFGFDLRETLINRWEGRK